MERSGTSCDEVVGQEPRPPHRVAGLAAASGIAPGGRKPGLPGAGPTADEVLRRGAAAGGSDIEAAGPLLLAAPVLELRAAARAASLAAAAPIAPGAPSERPGDAGDRGEARTALVAVDGANAAPLPVPAGVVLDDEPLVEPSGDPDAALSSVTRASSEAGARVSSRGSNAFVSASEASLGAVAAAALLAPGASARMGFTKTICSALLSTGTAATGTTAS